MKIVVCGTGGVGLSTAGYLAHQGHEITVLSRSERKRSELSLYLKYEGKLVGQDPALMKVPVTTDPSVVSNAELMLLCISAKGHKDYGHRLKDYLNLETPVVLFPGKFASSYLLKRCLDPAQPVGEVSTALFWSEAIPRRGSNMSYNVLLKNKKRSIEYAGIHPKKTSILDTLNQLFGECSFVDGKHPLRIALQNHDSTINAVSILANEGIAHYLSRQQAIKGWKSEGLDINLYGDLGLYAVSALERIFQVRLKIASAFAPLFGHNNPETPCLLGFEDWLRNINSGNLEGMDLNQMLQATYGDQTVHIDDIYSNRRLKEDVPYGLVPLESLAHELDIRCIAVTEAIDLANKMYVHKKQEENEPFLPEDVDFRKIGYKIEDFGINLNPHMRITQVDDFFI